MVRWSGWLCSSYLSSEYEISTLFCSPFKKEISTCLCSPQFIVDNKTFYNTVTTFYGSPKILHHYYYKLHYSGIVYNIMATDVYMKNYSLVLRSSFKIIVVSPRWWWRRHHGNLPSVTPKGSWKFCFKD